MDTIFDTKHLYRTYFKMALPVVLGLVVTLIYNLADTFFIAQTKDTALIRSCNFNDGILLPSTHSLGYR